MASKAKIQEEIERNAELAAVKNLKRIFPEAYFTRCTHCGHWCLTKDKKVRLHPLCRAEAEGAAREGSTPRPPDQEAFSL